MAPITKLKGTIPALPPSGKNPKLTEGEIARQPVKFQIILREGQEIVVGRIKVPTPAGHAFILRRFDTGAISLTTMYRACYPDIGDDWEKSETTWVKANYDTAGSNGGGKLRLAGTWIPPSLALTLADRYDLQTILPALAHAVPEPKATYRKGGKAVSSPEQTAVMNNAPTKNESTANVATALSVIPSSLPPTSPPRSARKSTGAAKLRAESPPARKKTRKSASPAPSLLAKPTPSKPIRASPRNIARTVDEEEAEVPAPDPDQDIAEAKEDVARAKAEYAARNAVTPSGSKKRSAKELETPPHKLDLTRVEQGAMDMVTERPVIARRRLANLPPNTKALAWGSLMFTLALGATAVLPMAMPGGSLGLW